MSALALDAFFIVFKMIDVFVQVTSDGAAAIAKGGLRATGGLTVQAGSMVVTAGGSSIAGVMQVPFEVYA